MKTHLLRRPARTSLACGALLLLGLARMAADLAGLEALGAVAAATGASPAPKVFSAVDGLETYSSRFQVEWTALDGSEQAVAITPHRYARLAGPYNRRNAYGAALAYGPVLLTSEHTRPLQQAVFRHAVCGDAPLLSELGIDARERVGAIRVRVEPKQRPADASWPTVLTGECV